MILAKAPLRVSFFGGGSDVPEHYLIYGGDVISTAINKYVYVAVNKTPHNHIKISYSNQELVSNVDDIENDIIRNALKHFRISSGIDISTFADIPTVGTGLAGSSAFTCALVCALAKFQGFNFDQYAIAETACYIELDLCGWKIGKQDQYASAFGGMNYIKFFDELGSGRITINRINPNAIDYYMLLIPTNIQRKAADILGNVDFKLKSEIIQDLALIARQNSDDLPNVDEYGRLLNIAWDLKKQMDNGISNPEIDEMYNTCIEAGAVGCKLLGAGGGGYMLVLTHSKASIKKAFSDRVCLDVSISPEGARVVYHD